MDEEKLSEDTRLQIKKLYDAGVTYKQIFGVYYELEEASNGRLMDVEDVKLADI